MRCRALSSIQHPMASRYDELRIADATQLSDLFSQPAARPRTAIIDVRGVVAGLHVVMRVVSEAEGDEGQLEKAVSELWYRWASGDDV